MVSLSDLLERMQENCNTGELRLKTDFGPATIWFREGDLVDAEIGAIRGEAAVFRLLGLTDGSFEVKSVPVRRDRMIQQPVRSLLQRRNQRSVEWKALVEKLPPLGTVLVLDLQSFSAASESLAPAQLELVPLIDGRRAIFEIIDDSGRDAVEVLRNIDALLSRGLVSVDDDDMPPPSQVGAVVDGESGIVPASIRPATVPPPAAPQEEPPDAVAELAQPGPPASTAMSPGGSKLGRYEVLSRLGRGGMGTVYLARITGEGGFRRLFAIKVLRSHLSQSGEATRMLLKEARIASRVDHPNIVSVVDVGTHEGQPYLVMDYVTGCSLADLLRAHSSQASTGAVVQIVLETLAGLHAAHTLRDDDGVALGVIHHDVSPHNIMVGQDGIARLSDFGVAYVRRHVGEGAEPNRGKPAFTAPERVSGAPGDHRSDLFSVGVILWTALTRTSLFDGEDIEATLENVLTMPVPAASRYGHSPPSLDAICFRALERDPAKRYQSAEEMLVHLRKVAVAEDLLGTPTEVRKWVKDAMGHELDVQRLSFLDAARMERNAQVDESSSLLVRTSASSGPPSERSRTIELVKRAARSGSTVKWVAVCVGVAILVLALLWPGKFKSLGGAKRVLPKEAVPVQTAPNR